MAFDAEGHLLIPVMSWIEIFNREGKLLSRFGESGDKPGEFAKVDGICTDAKDRAYVIDAGNFRIQVFQVSTPSGQHEPSEHEQKIQAAR